MGTTSHSLSTVYAGLTTTQVAENAAELKVDLKKGFIVAGDSAGANMAAAISIKARDDPFFAGHPLTGQYLREPAVAYPGAHPEKYKAAIRSFDIYADMPLLSKKAALRFFGTSSLVTAVRVQ